MARPNTKFDLSVADLDLIETALRSRKQSLAEDVQDIHAVNDDLKSTLHGIQDLLGRLHNQKEFFRPASGTYVGG